MQILKRSFVFLVLSLLSTLLIQGKSLADPSITEFDVNTQNISQPIHITKGPDGNLWFTDFSGSPNAPDFIRKITTSGSVTDYAIPSSPSNPQDITAGPDGNLWFTERNANKIGRITSSGTITEFIIPTASSHPQDITSGPDGNLWFTESTGDKIGKITPSGTFTEFNVSNAPYGITAGSDGNLWFTEISANKIAKITTSGQITEYSIQTTVPDNPPNNSTDPNYITAGPDGNLWFTEESANNIGKITPSGVITEYAATTSDSFPVAITAGSDGNLWFTESAGSNIGKITPSGTISEYPTPTSNSNPIGITSGPDNNIWFTELAAHQIGKVVIASAPSAPTNLTAPTPTNTAPALSWDSVSNADSYNIYRNGTNIGFSSTNSYTDNSASLGTNSYYVTAVNSAGESGASNTISVTYTSTVLAINSGGGTQGSFVADTDVSGGSTYSSSSSVDTSGVTNPAPEAVYQTVRYGNFTYTIPNLTANTIYAVRLHFNELYWNSSGSRVFNVSINGNQVLHNFDIFKTTGGENKALVEQFNATSDSNGQIAIAFSTVTDNAMVNGIELDSSTVPTHSLSSTVYNDTNRNGVQDTGETGYSGATVALSDGQTATTNSNGNYTFSNLPQEDTYTATVTLPNDYVATTTNPVRFALNGDTTENFGLAPFQSLSINAGGSSASSFVSDEDYSGGTPYSSSASVNTSGVTSPAPQSVYQTVRYGNTFSYTIPNLSASHNYTVRLHFNELYWNSAGSRVFNVGINGTQVLSNYDIFQDAGGENIAVVKQFTETPDTNGNITITFTTVTDNAMVNGIEVTQQ